MELPVQREQAMHEEDRLFEGGGEMGERIRNYDWASTPIGPISQWPQSLRTIVRIMMTSRQPIWIGWGPELIKLYNDPYKAIVGGKHPEALGKPASVVWADIWKDIEPMLGQVMQRNEGTYVESQLLIMERYGFPEETYYTFSYNPVPSGDGGVGGMFCTNTDNTLAVIGERQTSLLRALAANGTQSQSLEVVCRLAMESFREYPKDITFAALYLYDASIGIYRLSGSTGLKEDALPELIRPGKDESFWPFSAVLQGLKRLVEKVPAEFLAAVPENPVMRTDKAVLLPLGQPQHGGNMQGILVAGLNSLRRFDENYVTFTRLVASQLTANILHAQRYEDEQRRAKALEELDRSKTVFFSNISHEFRTPITLMLGPLEEILNKPSSGLDNKTRNQLEAAHRNAMRLLKLVNNLLDFSRIESGRQKASFALTDLVRLTKNLAGNFQSIIEKSGLQFNVIADSFIQPVYVDKDMWEKIVFNLLSNAFKFTLAGTITLSVVAEGQYAVLRVADTGCGIPADELPNLFQRFHRVHNTAARTFEGSGIGLSMIRELVRLHGGDISVRSEEGHGTTFEVRMPFGKDHIPKDQIASVVGEEEHSLFKVFIEEAHAILDGQQRDESATTGDMDKDLVLIVDDNADMRDHLRSLLQPFYRVITAANGMEALHKVTEMQPALIVSDIMMPILNGIGMVKELKRHSKTMSIPVILLTARAGEESRIEGYETGADDYLVKPFSSKELLARVRMQLRVRATRRNTEHYLHEVFMQAPIAVSIFKGRDLICEFANDSYLEMMQQTREKLLGLSMFDAMPETRETLFPVAMRLLDTGEPFRATGQSIVLYRNNREEVCWFNSIWTPLRDENGTITGIICCSQEIAAPKNADTEEVTQKKS